MVGKGARAWLPSNGLFFLTFAVLASYAFLTILRSPVGPGQDYNFHLFSASIAARGWTGDPAISALYHTVNPLDCNTLLYALLFPFVKLLGPVNGFKVGLGLTYFIGFPAACAAALSLFRRPMWGALLAFPLCWVRTYSIGGFIPFVSAAPFFVLAIALFHRLMSDAATRDVTPIPRRTLVKRAAFAMLACAAVFLAHAHVHGWLMVILAGITLWAMGQAFLTALPFSPLGAVRASVMTGLRALLVVTPSLLLLASWWFRRAYGDHSVRPAPPLPSPDTAKEKLDFIIKALVHIRHDDEYRWAAALIVVALLGFLLSARSRERLPTPELAFLLTIASCFLLPYTINTQGFGARQIDLAQFLLPLVVFARAPARAPARHGLIIVAIATFAFARTAFFGKHMRALQTEVVGLFDMAKPCPVSTGELAYVTFGREPETWLAESLHQSHETLAALCEIDTPVYDSQVYPFSLQPVRYRGALPAPVTILTDVKAVWYRHPRLWDDFDVVLVRNWNPTPEDLAEASVSADRIRISGTWQLWQRKKR